MPTFSFVGLPFDVLCALAVFVVLLAWNYTLGKHRSATLLLAIYCAGAAAALAPVVGFLDAILPLDAAYIPAATFVVMTIMVFILLRLNRFFEPYTVPNGWELAVFALLHSVLLVTIVVQLLPTSELQALSANFLRVFGDPTLRSAYIVAPLLVLFFVRGQE